MFLPSEAVFAELHAYHGAVVREGFEMRVFTVSPTTCMATLNTMRAILKDHRMKEAAGALRTELSGLVGDVEALGGRTAKLLTHFDQARRDLEGVAQAADRLGARAARIEAFDFGDAPRPAPRVIRRA